MRPSSRFRPLLSALLLVSVLVPSFGEPTEAQWAVVKKYDGMRFSTQGLKKEQTLDSGWTEYAWTAGRSLWENPARGWWAVVEADGTEVYRYSASDYTYNFPDGRVIKSNPGTGVKTWSPMAGDPAPDFDLPVLNGTGTVKLSGLRGQVVFLDFWASWCGPCQNALPGTEALYRKFKAAGLKVYGVNIEGDTAKARSNAAALGLTFPTLMAAPGPNGRYNWDSAQVAAYQVTGIPHGLLIDKKGIIRARDTIIDDEELIRKLLEE